jgi:hypothetical protein
MKQSMEHSIPHRPSLFQRPFPLETDRARRFTTACIFGIAIASFLLVFEPFGISRVVSPWKPLIIAFYGVITTFWLLVIYFIAPLVFPNTFQEERWTVGKYIITTTAIVLCIAVSNYLYSVAVPSFSFTLSWKPFLNFFLWTMLLALPLVTVLTLVLERQYLRQHLAAAMRISATLEQAHHQQTSEDESQERTAEAEVITLVGTSPKEQYELNPASILCIQASDNYVTVFYESNNIAKKLLFRSTLKSLEEQIATQQGFMRCHKSFIVNMNRVESVSGNAQGYKLHLPVLDFAVSVSRSLQNTILDELQGKHAG